MLPEDLGVLPDVVLSQGHVGICEHDDGEERNRDEPREIFREAPEMERFVPEPDNHKAEADTPAQGGDEGIAVRQGLRDGEDVGYGEEEDIEPGHEDGIDLPDLPAPEIRLDRADDEEEIQNGEGPCLPHAPCRIEFDGIVGGIVDGGPDEGEVADQDLGDG